MADPMTEKVRGVTESGDPMVLKTNDAAMAAAGAGTEEYQAILVSRLFFRAAFPVMKVPLQDDPKMTARFADCVEHSANSQVIDIMSR